MNNEIISLPDNTTSVLVHQSVTSANVLCKYMKNVEYLHDILMCSAMKPRYVEEMIEYLDVSGVSSIAIPMICFCDIPLSKVSNHTSNYGEYGIAFYKHKCINKNVQPITYINIHSNYYNDLRDTISTLIDSEEVLEEKWQILSDFILTQLAYSKPVEGEMRKSSGRERVLFKDECEWRFVPSLPDDMSLVLNPTKTSLEKLTVFDEALASNNCRETWFDFDPDDICYLIVPNESEASNLINFINTKLRKLDRKTRNLLISKIEVSSKIVRDY